MDGRYTPNNGRRLGRLFQSWVVAKMRSGVALAEILAQYNQAFSHIDPNMRMTGIQNIRSRPMINDQDLAEDSPVYHRAIRSLVAEGYLAPAILEGLPPATGVVDPRNHASVANYSGPAGTTVAGLDELALQEPANQDQNQAARDSDREESDDQLESDIGEEEEATSLAQAITGQLAAQPTRPTVQPAQYQTEQDIPSPTRTLSGEDFYDQAQDAEEDYEEEDISSSSDPATDGQEDDLSPHLPAVVRFHHEWMNSRRSWVRYLTETHVSTALQRAIPRVQILPLQRTLDFDPTVPMPNVLAREEPTFLFAYGAHDGCGEHIPHCHDLAGNGDVLLFITESQWVRFCLA